MERNREPLVETATNLVALEDMATPVHGWVEARAFQVLAPKLAVFHGGGHGWAIAQVLGVPVTSEGVGRIATELINVGLAVLIVPISFTANVIRVTRLSRRHFPRAGPGHPCQEAFPDRKEIFAHAAFF